MVQRQRRGRGDAFVIMARFWQAGCVPSAAKPLSPGAGVSPLLIQE